VVGWVDGGYMAFDLCSGCYGKEAGRLSNVRLKRPNCQSCPADVNPPPHTHTHTHARTEKHTLTPTHSHILTDGMGQLGNVSCERNALCSSDTIIIHPAFIVTHYQSTPLLQCRSLLCLTTCVSFFNLILHI